jgi:hypothetical protein
MPTGFGATAADLIQFGFFAAGNPFVENYGVAPDFACGHHPYLPRWAVEGAEQWRNFLFVNKSRSDPRNGPGFYLAIYRASELGLLEAFDTWLHPDVTYEEFVDGVKARNGSLDLVESREFEYVTANGNRLTAEIWHREPVWVGVVGFPVIGAEVRRIEYGNRNSADAIGDAGNRKRPFLSGTVLTSPGEAIVKITNPSLKTTMTLDMSDPWHPRRIGEHGEIEEAGNNHEVWVDFDWQGSTEGDVFRPFNKIAAAIDAVAANGVVKIVPGTTIERLTISGRKRIRLVAPIGGVIIGARDPARRRAVASTTLPPDRPQRGDVWVQLGFPASAEKNIPGPFNDLASAVDAVAAGGTIRILPGVTHDRMTLSGRKPFTISAPVGGVVIGARPRSQAPGEVWVNFAWPRPGTGTRCDPYQSLDIASAAVARHGVVKALPGETTEWRIGTTNRFRLTAVNGRVTMRPRG